MPEEKLLYTCPFGCTPHRALDTLRKWKSHMSRIHHGFTPEQVQAATGGDVEGVHIAGGDTFESFAQSMPEDANEYRSDYVPPSSTPSPSPSDYAAAEAKQRVTKKISGRMKALQEGAASVPMEFLQRKGGIVYNERQQKMIGEAFQLMFDILDIGVEVEPIGYKITNPWYFVFLPFALMIAFLIFNKAEQAESNEPAGE